MKLKKNNASKQKAIRDALASGRALGGLLVGLASATMAGGCLPSRGQVMGDVPNPNPPREQCAPKGAENPESPAAENPGTPAGNAANETKGRSGIRGKIRPVLMGRMVMPDPEEEEKQPESAKPEETEKPAEEPKEAGEPEPKNDNAANEKKDCPAVDGLWLPE